MKAVGFAPGHISAFFEPIFNAQNMDRCGSRGAGIATALGATSNVALAPASNQDIQVSINGKVSPAPVTKLAVKHLIRDSAAIVKVNTNLALPMGQGFGMSGAGALSTTLALTKLLGLPQEEGMKAAHYAEVQLRTGLGDVVASSFGGIEIRREAGLPPWGIIEHIPGDCELVLCVVGKKINTKKILSNPLLLSTISSYGRMCTKKILEKPSIEQLFALSNFFTQKTKLGSEKVQQAIKAASKYGMISMCMLGNAVFSVGDTNELCSILSTLGKVWVCPVDTSGARVVEVTC